MEAACSSKMPVDFQRTTQHYKPEDRTHSCAVLTEARCSNSIHNNFTVDSVQFRKYYGCMPFFTCMVVSCILLCIVYDSAEQTIMV
jgi:hypothetical protein